MKWFMPSFNGDFRLEPKDGKLELMVVEPTANECSILERFLKVCRKKGWVPSKLSSIRKKPTEDAPEGVVQLVLDGSQKGEQRLVVDGPIEKVGVELVKLSKPAASSITAVRYSGGKVEVEETHAIEKVEKIVEAAKEDKEAKAATVKRPTPCCPQCFTGEAVKPATEVLLSFLTPQQHRDWSRHRILELEGGRTGHRYLLAHRNSKQAARWGRICFDADDGEVVAFHDNSHPPEEEVLSAMLVLQYREPWLRNEATCYLGGFREVFKNPFGDLGDGTESAGFAQALGVQGMFMNDVLKTLGVNKATADLAVEGLFGDDLVDVAKKLLS